eukprot:COSAG05_NODE_3384_length_2095_cov_2.021543_1_plen_106_part_00
MDSVGASKAAGSICVESAASERTASARRSGSAAVWTASHSSTSLPVKECCRRTPKLWAQRVASKCNVAHVSAAWQSEHYTRSEDENSSHTVVQVESLLRSWDSSR